MAILMSSQSSSRRYLASYLLSNREAILQELEALVLRRGMRVNAKFSLLITPFLPGILEDFSLLLLSTKVKAGNPPFSVHEIPSADKICSEVSSADLPQVVREYHLLKSVMAKRMKSEMQLDSESSEILQLFIDNSVESIINQLVPALMVPHEIVDFMMQSPVPMMMMEGPKHRYVYSNPAHDEFLNLKVTGKTFKEISCSQVFSKFNPVLDEVYQTGKTWESSEVPWVRINAAGSAESSYINISLFPSRNPDGLVKGLFGIVRDITDQVINRENLKASEERFRQLSESLTHQVVHVMELNPQRLSYVSPSFESIWKLPLAEVYQNPNSFIRRVYPDDQPKLLEALKRLNEGHETDVEFRLVLNDGSIRWIKDHSTPLTNKDGKIYRATGIAEDITEQKIFEHRLMESEAKFRTIADAMPQMVWSTLPDGFHDYFNQRWYEFTGTSQGSTDGEAWNGMFHPDDRERAWNSWRLSLETGDPYQIEYRLKHRSGQYRWTLGRALPIRDELGKIIRWMGTCTDIQTMRETSEALTRAVEARDEFLSIASHELKTPLTSLKLQAQLMKRDRGKGDPSVYSVKRVDKMIAQTDEQVLRLTRLIDDMLDISRIRSGNLGIRRESFDLGQLVTDTVERLQPHFLATGYQLPVIEADPKCMGEWDRMRIEQVLINLLTNSIRYGNHKPIHIRIENLGFKIRLSVCDQGIGIAAESQAKIFNRFERAITANEVSGLGLGLYISRKIVEAHQGRIWVESKLGQGSTFFVELPAQHYTLLSNKIQ